MNNYIEYPIGKSGKTTKISNGDVIFVSNYRLLFKNGYVFAKTKGGVVPLTRLILGLTRTKRVVDHVNHDTLDNRRENIRAITQQQNTFNSKTKKSETGIKGVLARKGYVASLQINGKAHSKTLKTEAEAVELYNEYSKEYHLDFGQPNKDYNPATPPVDSLTIKVGGKDVYIDKDVYDSLPSKWLVLTKQGYIVMFINQKDSSGKSKRVKVRLHRHILGLSKGDGLESDHIDNNPLNNCRNNLRVCLRAENRRNQRRHANKKTSQFKGVFARAGFMTKVGVEGHSFSMGVYYDQKTAAIAYDIAARYFYGKFAYINYKDEEINWKTTYQKLFKSITNKCAMLRKKYKISYKIKEDTSKRFIKR